MFVLSHIIFRYKCARAVRKHRLKIYFSNMIVIKYFFWKLYGVTLVHEQMDQKGVHFNESGSKNQPTLELADRMEVPLVENHAQTRERMSMMTITVSDLVRYGKKLPLEMMFKLKTNRMLKDLYVPDVSQYTFQHSDSGSYRTEHVVEYLKRHLVPWSAERAAIFDYRILGLDAYSPHKNDQIPVLAWERGYIYAEGTMMPAGCTGDISGPDTDLHGWVESEIIALQDISMSAKLSKQPGKVPSQNRASMTEFCVAIWETADHKQGEASFKRNGLDNALDGTEDDLIKRTALEFWNDNSMSDLRPHLKAEVDIFFDTLDRPVEPRDVFGLLQDYSAVSGGIGDIKEGEDLICDSDKGSAPEDSSNEDELMDDGEHVDKSKPAPSEQQPVQKGVMEVSSASSQGDPLGHDLHMLTVMLGIAKKMNDKATALNLQQKFDRLQKVARRVDKAVEGKIQQHFAAEASDVLASQETAKLEDAAAAALKRFNKKTVKKPYVGNTRLPLPPAKPLALFMPPAVLDVPKASPVHPSPELPPPILDVPKASPVHSPPDCDAIVAVPSAEVNKAKDKKYKKDKKDKKEKKHKHSKKHKLHKKHKKPGKGEVRTKVLAVEVDSEVKLRKIFKEATCIFDHPHKSGFVLWLARKLHDDANLCRKAGLVFPRKSIFLGKPLTSHKDLEKGVLEKLVLDGLFSLPLDQRIKFFKGWSRVAYAPS